MAGQYERLLDPRILVLSQTQNKDEVFDAGAFTQLQIQFRVLKAGTGGALSLQHAAINEESAYQALTGATVNLNAIANSLVSVTNFLRYIRWVTDANVADSPVALIDIVAKE